MKVPVKLIKCEYPPNPGVLAGDKIFDELFESIKKQGILEPLTIHVNWFIIDGNHRLSVARYLGITHVEVKVWTGTEFVE
ncbi:MAG: hypothetical protein E2O29_01450 [Deltaproteobacteria bacterium]|nr:MAG: hypothetical protein E2O29_01450 [Deltaproteobacteria bacterium]